MTLLSRTQQRACADASLQRRETSLTSTEPLARTITTCSAAQTATTVVRLGLRMTFKSGTPTRWSAAARLRILGRQSSPSRATLSMPAFVALIAESAICRGRQATLHRLELVGANAHGDQVKAFNYQKYSRIKKDLK